MINTGRTAARNRWTSWAWATVITTTLLGWGLLTFYRPGVECSMVPRSAARDTAAALPGSCSSDVAILGLLMLGAVGYLGLGGLVGLCVGAADGRDRRPFARGGRLSLLVVGLAAPWIVAGYAIGQGLGRLWRVPPRLRDAAAGRGAAGRVLEHLVRGGQPIPVPGSAFLSGEAILLDTVMAYSRYYGTNVTFQTTSVAAVGSPGVVAVTMFGAALGNSRARSRAWRLAQAQWREHQVVRVVVTDTRTWCQVSGRWLQFGHHGVLGYVLDDDSVVLTFEDCEPLRLSGPPAWTHAVLFGYLRAGAGALQGLPFLQPVLAEQPSAAASQRAIGGR